jgi:ABC-type multidrug transport system fused ATPase/permease subunit
MDSFHDTRAQPDAAELWHASEPDLERVACSHGRWLLASVGVLLAAPEVRSDEQALSALTARLALLLPAYPHLEPFLSALCERECRSSLPFRVDASMPAESMLLTLRAGLALCAAAPHLAHVPYLRCSEVLTLLADRNHSVSGTRTLALRLLLDSLRLSDAPRALLLSAVGITEANLIPLLSPMRLQPLAPHIHARPDNVSTPGPSIPPGVVCIGQELLCCLGSSSPAVDAPSSPQLVRTEHYDQVLQSLSIALCSAAPVLLSGPTGSGKSALLVELAGLMGQRRGLVRVHMDEQIDSKVRHPRATGFGAHMLC